MLDKLAIHDEKWRQIALRITKGDKFHADDLVSEMYLRVHRNYRGQELNESYIGLMILSIYRNEIETKKTNRIILTDNLRTISNDKDAYSIDDENQELIDRYNELPFLEKKLFTLSFDYSLRKISEKYHNKSYGHVYKTVKKARRQVLGDKYNQYKRLKHRKMKSKGLGDTIEKITKATGIKKLVDKMNVDCGCDERKEYLNKLFAYKLKPRCFTSEELQEYADFVRGRKFKVVDENKGEGAMTNQEITYLVSMYNSIFSVHYDYPSCLNCGGTAKLLIKMVNDLDKVYLNNIPEQKKVTRKKKTEVTDE